MFVTASKILDESTAYVYAVLRYCSLVYPAFSSAFSYSERSPSNLLLIVWFSSLSTSASVTFRPSSSAACWSCTSSTRRARLRAWTLWYSGVPAFGNAWFVRS